MNHMVFSFRNSCCTGSRYIYTYVKEKSYSTLYIAISYNIIDIINIYIYIFLFTLYHIYISCIGEDCMYMHVILAP